MAGILLNLLAATAGGQVTRAEAFLRRFRRYNPDMRLVILKCNRSLSFCDDVSEWEVKNVSLGAGRFRAAQRMAWENFFLPLLMRKEGLDVYLTFSHYLPPFIGTNVRSIVGVSNLAPFSAEAWDVESHAVRAKMCMLRHSIVSSAKRADQVIALSNTCKRVLINFGLASTRITVIPNGVEPCAPGKEINSPTNLPFEGSYILSVSHFHRYKNFECLVEAYALLPADLRKRFPLVIIGKAYDQKYYGEIERLVSQSGMDGHILIVPGMERAQLDSLYRNASLFVFPSLIENSPNILLEAMIYGLPVLANNVDPMLEFGGDAINYFEGLSTEDLARRMTAILSDRAGAADSGLRAKKRAKEYSWDAFTESVVDLCFQTITHS